MPGELKVFTGNAHPQLARDICRYLNLPLGQVQVFKFSNDNIFVKILENVRERDVFLVQPFSYPVSDHILELLIMIDAAKRASAGRITAVVPYYAYGRTDKKDQPRVPITGRLLADLLTVAGASRMLTIDMHAGQIQGFFNIPVDELTAFPLLARHIRQENLKELVVVATDIGITKRARDVAARLHAPLVIIEKRRIGNQEQTETLNIIGEVDGKVALLVDDEIDTGGSLTTAADALLGAGATEIHACCVHPVFSGNAVERIQAAHVEQVVVCDTIPIPEQRRTQKIHILSVASLLGEAIRRIHEGQSVGEMFEREE